MTRVLVIDNYDSFTWNLVHLIAPLASQVEVVRNDATSSDAILAHAPDALVLSPGPCTPNEAGICLDVVRRVSPAVPTFGVCLGLQTIGQVFGGAVVRAPLPMHGKVSDVDHRGEGVFRGINGPIRATRYHSLVVERDTCPEEPRDHGGDRGTGRSWASRTVRSPSTECSSTPRASSRSTAPPS
jgi:anthranilate synthase component 2